MGPEPQESRVCPPSGTKGPSPSLPLGDSAALSPRVTFSPGCKMIGSPPPHVIQPTPLTGTCGTRAWAGHRGQQGICTQEVARGAEGRPQGPKLQGPCLLGKAMVAFPPLLPQA